TSKYPLNKSIFGTCCFILRHIRIMNFQQLMLKTGSMLGSRLALNIYFWLFLFVIKIHDISEPAAYSAAFQVGCVIFLMSVIAGICYFNNFILLPRFLLK